VSWYSLIKDQNREVCLGDISHTTKDDPDGGYPQFLLKMNGYSLNRLSNTSVFTSISLQTSISMSWFVLRGQGRQRFKSDVFVDNYR
jgi:hypothetical protein